MRDRVLIALACLLAGGAWVCDGSDDNRCPGATTCAVEVANVCCPLGSLNWCDSGCSDTGCATQSAHHCDDTARILDCSFDASVTSATCGSPRSTTAGTEYTLTVKGTLSGCGQEGVHLGVDSALTSDADTDCGSWDNGVYGGCVSPSPEMTTTHFSLRQQILGDAATITIQRMHGSAPPIVTHTVACNGSL